MEVLSSFAFRNGSTNVRVAYSAYVRYKILVLSLENVEARGWERGEVVQVNGDCKRGYRRRRKAVGEV